MSLRLAIFLADFDGQRACLAAKGSAGLKPCLLCANCVAAYSPAAEAGAFLRISECDIGRFSPLQEGELHQLMDRTLPRLAQYTQQQRKLRETLLGFNFQLCSLWNCRVARSQLSLGKVCNDSMHCYFANGIAGLEMLLFLQQVKRKLGVGVERIADAACSAGWQRPARKRSQHGETAYWHKRLWRPTLFIGDFYKGSASQTVALMSLLRWFTLQLGWSDVAAIAPYARCFLALCRCAQLVLRIDVTRSFDALEAAQQEHQRLFVELYPHSVRPKHHHRLHLPSHYRKFGVVVNCWPTEAKHKDYKGVVARHTQHFLQEENGGRSHSMRLLPKLLLRGCVLLREANVQRPPSFELDGELAAETVRQQFGRSDCRAALGVAWGLLRLKADDVLWWGETRRDAGVLRLCVVADGALHLCMQQLSLQQEDQSMRVFRLQAPTFFQPCAQLHMLGHPEWTSRKDDRVVCLL